MNNKLLNNKQEKFEREALEYLDSLYNTSFYLVRNSEDAKDLVQDTYYKAFKYYYQFKESTNLKAWLFKILKNNFINSYRKKAKEPQMLEYSNVEPFLNIVQDNDGHMLNKEEESILNKFFSDDVTSSLEKLPYDFKTVIILSDIEGFSYREIAEIMDCPLGTVRSRLSRARKVLQKMLLFYAQNNGIIKKQVTIN